MFESNSGRQRLVRTYEVTDTKTFDDWLHCCMVTVEDGLITSGAAPGVDYTMLDLAKLAIPVALADTSKDITTGIPYGHPHAGNHEVKKTPGNPSEYAGEDLAEAMLVHLEMRGDEGLSGNELRSWGKGRFARLSDIFATRDELLRQGRITKRTKNGVACFFAPPRAVEQAL